MALAVARLVEEAPSLCARRPGKGTAGGSLWLRCSLSARIPRTPAPPAASVRVAVAVDCLNVAIDHWSVSEGRLDLVGLLDEAFTAVAP